MKKRLKDFSGLVNNEAAKCAKCGACRTVCPIFRETGREKFTARGKLELSWAFIHGTISSGELAPVVDNCLLCLACVDNCSSNIRFDRVNMAVREQLVMEAGLPVSKRTLFRIISGSRLILEQIIKTGSFLQPFLLKRIPEKSGFRMRFPLPGFDRERYIPKLPVRTFQSRIPKIAGPGRDSSSKTVLFFTGCAVNYLFPEIGEALVKVLKTLGVTVVVPKDQVCCGMMMKASGDRRTLMFLAKNNLSALLPLPEDAKVVTVCGSGGFMFKYIYPELFTDGTDEYGRAQALSKNTYDICEYLVKEVGISTVKEKIRYQIPAKTSYHDPCHLNRGQGIADEPRALLKLVCRDNFTELPEAAACCGAGGTYGIFHRDVSCRILARKTTSLRISGCRIVATGCPGCLIQLTDGINREKMNVIAVHTIETIAMSMGLHEEKAARIFKIFGGNHVWMDRKNSEGRSKFG